MSKLRRAKQLEKVIHQATICLKRGWQPIPVPEGTKRPFIKAWPKVRYELSQLNEAFGEGDNIGLLTGDASGGLVDVDLDSPEAIVAAPYFLPPTERAHGRRSKPCSHFFYVVDPVPQPAKYAEKDGFVHVELRSNGQQTLIPPSIHPSGERLHWKKAGQASRVNAEELTRSVREVAASAILARYWPSKGSRHDASLALAGFLAGCGWDAAKAETFVKAVTEAAGDEEGDSRLRDVQSTYEKVRQGKPVTGRSHLASIVGEEAVENMEKWLRLQLVHGSQSMTQITSRVIPSWPEPLSSAAFIGLAGEIVRAIEPHSEADPVALLLQLLVGFGNLVGRKAFFTAGAQRHFSNTYATLVGATSSSRKGTSWTEILRILERVDAEWAGFRRQSGLSSGEGLIWAVRDALPKQDDVGVADKRLLVVETELAQQLKLMARPGNILSMVVRQAWDSGALGTLTKHSPAKATDAHISIIAHITQEELRRHLNHTESANGFANRFLWLSVRRSKVLPEGGEVPEAALEELSSRLKAAAKNASVGRAIKRSEKAKRLWHEVYGELSEGKAGLLGAITSRAEAQAMRVAMLYALLDCSSTIQRRHLRAGLAVWKYAQDSARFIFGDSLGNPLADEILKALENKPEGLTRTEISSHFGNHRSSEQIERALFELAKSGRARRQTQPTEGRPIERWSAVGFEAKNAK